jgi:hypothetical protein
MRSPCRWAAFPVSLFIGLGCHEAEAQGNGRRGNLGWEEIYRLEIEYRRWRPALVSDLEVGGGPVYPASDLGLGQRRVTEYRGGLRLHRSVRVRGSYIAPFSYLGQESLGRDISFGGASLPAGTVADTSIEVQHLRTGAEIDLLTSRDGLLGVVVDYSRWEARPVIASSLARGQSDPLRVALPTVGLLGKIYLHPRLSLSAEASGMRRATRGVITEFEALARVNLSPRIGVATGYRNLYARVASGGDRGAFRLRGWFFSLALRL